MEETIVIRRAGERDSAAVAYLAALDSRPVPRGELLLAIVDGELRAALSLSGSELVADPFKPTQPLAALLRLRAVQGGTSDGSQPGSPEPRRPLRVLARLAEAVQA